MDFSGNMTYAAATKEMEELLLKYWPDKPEHAHVNIYTWPDKGQKKVGLRIAEVSLSSVHPTKGTGGGVSFMQNDVEGGQPLFHVERAVLAIHHQPERPDEEEVLDLIDAKWRAIFAIEGEAAAKAFADDAYPKEQK